MTVPPLTLDCALFIDFDGTLVNIAGRPDAVVVDPALPTLLAQVSTALDGAVAVISGRSLEVLDSFLGGRVAAIAGIHGLVRRSSGSIITRAHVDEEVLSEARRALASFVSEQEGVLLEDKGVALALHYRNAHHCEAACRAAVQVLAQRHPEALVVQPGKMVQELRPRGGDKGAAVAAFLNEPPFRGRSAVYLGDDLTDEAGFRLVNDRGGLSVRVGGADGSAARYTLPDVPAVHRWLTTICTGR